MILPKSSNQVIGVPCISTVNAHAVLFAIHAHAFSFFIIIYWFGSYGVSKWAENARSEFTPRTSSFSNGISTTWKSS